MSAVVTSIICSLILNFSIIFIVKKLMGDNSNIFSVKFFLSLIILLTLQTIFYSGSYNIIYIISNYLAIILFLKINFNGSMTKTLTCTAITILIQMLADFLNSVIFLNFVNLNDIRGIWYLRIFSNVIVSSLSIAIFLIPICRKKCEYFTSKTENKNISTIVLLIILITVIVVVTYSMPSEFKLDSQYFANIFILLTLIVFCYIFINENNQYNKLNDEYDNLFKYIQIFEDWIEKEQLNRHEYRNQLSSLRCMTKEKKLKDKIDSILLDNINIANDTVNQLKPIPNGGLKGLLYYKISVAESKKIHVELDISIKKSDLIKKLSEDNMKTICRLIGIYLDNAIEGAIETRKKILSIEIYDFDNDINIVITNTFNNKNDISRRNENGFTTKGKGHGKGLYFAGKMLAKNNWLKEEQSIMDKYYIQRLVIKNRSRNN